MCTFIPKAITRAVVALAFVMLNQQSTIAADRLEITTESSQQEESQIVMRLQEKLASGELSFEWNPRYGYLESLLKGLEIPIDSQLLVFSKTSQLREHITPQNPRAVYFNDDVYVAWVPNTQHIEIAAIEPNAGSVFYMLEQNQKRKAAIESSVQCLECHTSNRNLGIPGPIVRSFPTDDSGSIERNNGVSAVNHTTPLNYRWGGWYATGATKIAHRGNRFGDSEEVKEQPAGLPHLNAHLDVKKYPTNSSDMVALLILEHQAHMQNLITRLHKDAEKAMAQNGNLSRIRESTTDFLKYLLFIDEAPLKSLVTGSTDYAAEFQSKGPKDSKGRSLRDLNLNTRLLEHPCSYLIYSESFRQMHPSLQRHLYRRLYDILTGEDSTEDFEKLTREQRKAIMEILTETIDDLPTYWTL